MKNIKRFSWLFVAIMLAVTPISVMAQETASAIAGTIVDSDGAPVTGATVVIKHGPTGATKTLTTNDKGNYQARGLRVGGPYSITISKSEYGDVNQEDIYIKLGEKRDIDATIVSESVSLESIEVVGVAQSDVFNPDSMGTAITIDSETLENMPTISRNVQDFLKLDSRINIRDFGEGISVSGVNNRFNNFAIDGVGANDPFGLEANGFAGLGQPFNIDTIDQLNVQLSPYNVTLSNFTGASINAVTKSGTNDFTGSVNIQYGNENYTRDLEDFTNEIYSVTLGGPIIKDKLFFFIGFEDTTRSEVPNSSNVATSDLQEVIDISSNVYGFDAGSITPNGFEDTKQNLLVKFDWIINENHRAAFTFNTNEDNQAVLPDLGGNRASLSSRWYNNNFEKDSYALNVYSDWSPNFTTELRLSRSDFDKNPSFSNVLPSIRISNVGENGDTIYLGRDIFRHANSLAVTDETFYLEGNYFVGNHTIKAGVDIQKHDIFNVFVFQSYGDYRFDSIDDYRNGIVDAYFLRLGTDPNNRFPAADWAWTGTGLFIQDNWMVNQDLTIQYGFRYDRPDTSDTPLFNQDFTDAYGFRNDSVIDTGVLQPRIGFNLDLSDERMMQVHGGIGIFSGGSPNVWLSNPFTNPGVGLASFRVFDGSVGLNPDGLNQQLPPNGTPLQDVDVLEPGFELPSVLKSNLALDMELPWYGIVARMEYEYTQQRQAIFYKHLNLGTPTGTLPDGRNSYFSDPLDPGSDETANANPAFGDVVLLKNSGHGDLKRATISLEKRTEHFFTKASYTNTTSSEISTGTSSRAISSWNNRPSFNPNDPETGVSAYQIENAFTFLMNYSNNFFGDTITNVGLFWTSSDGEPYSYNFSNDVNGDGVRDNDLFYVPLEGEYVLTDPADTAAFEAFITATGLERGAAATRNSHKAPRINLWDLKIKQELPSFGFGRASLFFSVKNLGNLLNKDWGQVKLGSFDGVNIARLNGFDSEGRWILDWNGRDFGENLFTSNISSQWQAQIGFRFDW